MSCQDEVLRVGKKLEKMILSKSVVSTYRSCYLVRFIEDGSCSHGHNNHPVTPPTITEYCPFECLHFTGDRLSFTLGKCLEYRNP